MSRNGDWTLIFGPGIAFLAGMITLITVFWKGPIEKINNSIASQGRTFTAFQGLMNRLARIGTSFEYFYIKEKVSTELLEKLNTLLEDAMRDTNELLAKTEIKGSDEETHSILDQIVKKINKNEVNNKGKKEINNGVADKGQVRQIISSQTKQAAGAEEHEAVKV